MTDHPISRLIADLISAHKRSLGHAIRNQLRTPDSLPLILLAIGIPLLALVAAGGIEIKALVNDRDFNSVLMASPSWVGFPFLVGVYLTVLIWGRARVPTSAVKNEAIVGGASELKEGQTLEEKRLIADVLKISRLAGLDVPPTVLLWNREYRNAGAYARLLDRGVLVIDMAWIRSAEWKAVRFVIAHEIAHILHRDLILKFLGRNASFALAVLPTMFMSVFVGSIGVATAFTLGLAAVMSVVIPEGHSLLAFFAAVAALVSFLARLWPLYASFFGALSFVQGMRWYLLRLERKRELEADRMAKSICGTLAAVAAMEFLAGCDGNAEAMPLRPSLTICISAVFEQFLALCGKIDDPDMVLRFFRWPSRILGTAIWLITRIPGADELVQRLERTHPTVQERALALGVRLVQEPSDGDAKMLAAGAAEIGHSENDDRAA